MFGSFTDNVNAGSFSKEIGGKPSEGKIMGDKVEITTFV
jgi:hypothetical protein